MPVPLPLSTNSTPAGSATPPRDSAAAGNPLVVTVNDPKAPTVNVVLAALVIVGALNWGLVAVAEFDLVAWIFGGMEFGETNAASRVIYGLVGLAGVYCIASFLAARRTERRPVTAGAR